MQKKVKVKDISRGSERSLSLPCAHQEDAFEGSGLFEETSH
jgi:hypothetical protein